MLSGYSDPHGRSFVHRRPVSFKNVESGFITVSHPECVEQPVQIIYQRLEDESLFKEVQEMVQQQFLLLL